MKIFFYIGVLLMLPILIFSQNQNTINYIEKYKEIAINEMKRTNIPASITLAQAILESSSGESSLAAKFNNHFGIKCKSDWKGETTYKDDDKKNECFRVYPSAESSFIDHSNFLKNRPNYTTLFELDPVDDTAWAYGLKKAGYATERDYPQRLLKIIDDYELAQYNYPELDTDSITQEKVMAPVKDTSKNKVILVAYERDTLTILKHNKDSVSTLKSSYVIAKPTISSDTITLSNINGISSDTVILAPIANMNGISGLIVNSLPVNSDSIIISKDTTRPIMEGDAIRPNLSKDSTVVRILKETNINSNKIDTASSKKENPYPLNQKFKINQVPAIWGEKGRSFLEIANTYHVPLFKIYKFNKLPETDLVEQDQLIYLGEPKKDTTSANPIIYKTKTSLKRIFNLPFLKKKDK